MFANRLIARCLPLTVTLALSLPPAMSQADDPLDDARTLLLRGKYAEALNAYQALLDEQPVAASIGAARAAAATGHADHARTLLTQALATHADDAELHAWLAWLAAERGDAAEVDRHVAAALAAQPDHRLARWLAAERLRTQGQLDRANDAYHWFVDYYNAHDALTVDDLHWVGLAAAHYARWNRLSDQFTFLVNDLYPGMLAQDPAVWQAHLEAGRLFLEKFNQAEASRELEAALELNPNASEALAALAALAVQDFDLERARRALDQALAVNPHLIEGHYLYADTHLANFELAEAVARLEQARELNPASEQVLGRLAASYGVLDGLEHRDPDSRLGRLIVAADERNPHNGEFYATLAAALDRMRKYPAAVEFYEVAIERMPQLVETRAALGLLYLRMGDETSARRLLDESFDIDPFNVRVSNSLKVLEVLDGYAVLETPHFVIRFDRGADELLAQAIAAYLEDEVYPELTRQFDFEPADKSLFEIFNRARSTGGHGWFSARMVGLPYVGTVGACAGKMVAMVSPADMPRPFNWTRVVKHEFVHVLNLQQTNFNIPHWFTEALAVESENHPRPHEWNRLLVERVAAGDVFNLDTINLGFVRPRSGEDWSLAYCQAQLYAQYLVATYGEDALAKMLAAYRDNLDTRSALQRCFDVEQETFEAGYTRHVATLVASLPGARTTTQPASFAELQRAHEASPDDLEVATQLAQAYLDRKANVEARRLADDVLAHRPEHPRATYVVARLKLAAGEDAAAREMLDRVLDESDPDEPVLRLLAGLEASAANYERAAELYELGSRRFVQDPQWLKSLAVTCIKAGDDQRLRQTLEQLADADGDDFLVRKKLAQMAVDRGDRGETRRWTTEALHIDVNDATLHYQLGQALAADGERERALAELRAAVRIDPKLAEASTLLETLAP